MATVILTTLSLCVAGSVLIVSLFRVTLGREVDNAAKENQMLQFTMSIFFGSAAGDIVVDRQNITELIHMLEAKINLENYTFRIVTEYGEIYYETQSFPVREELWKSVKTTGRSYVMVENAGAYTLQTASIIKMDDRELLLESCMDITDLFEDRRQQYRIFQTIILVVLLVDGVGSVVISMYLTRPLKAFSEAAKRISMGNYSERVQVRGSDELASLAEDFNQMAESLEQKIGELSDAARRQEDFIGNFAHELKTPLTSIIGYADLLRSGTVSGETAVMASNYIFQEGKRLESLALKLMELMVARHQNLEKRRIYGPAFLEETKGLLVPVLEKNQVELKVRAKEGYFYAEPDLMKTVVLNLIDNSIKAIDKKGRILLGGWPEEGGYCIFVRDNGKGMKEEEIPKITEAFYMIDKSRSRQRGGAGLGLALCQEIVMLHGGEIEFKSRPGKGTTVLVHLKGVEAVGGKME